jgi:hypothetical protein
MIGVKMAFLNLKCADDNELVAKLTYLLYSRSNGYRTALSFQYPRQGDDDVNGK